MSQSNALALCSVVSRCVVTISTDEDQQRNIVNRNEVIGLVKAKYRHAWE